MKLTKGEFSQFSLKGKISLLEQYGQSITKIYYGYQSIQIYKIYDFYAELIVNHKKLHQVERVDLISTTMMNYYKGHSNY